MGLKYGLTNPAAMMGSEDIVPDLFKYYSAYPSDSSQSSASSKRRPQLFTSLNYGRSWQNENTGSSSGWYHVNYGGNLFFNHENSNGKLEAWGHKSLNSGYSAYKAVQDPPHLKKVGWTTSSAVPYSTTNQPNRELCRNHGVTHPNRYFCIKEGGGYAYNDAPWSTANWTAFNFSGVSNITLTDDGGFKHICIDPQTDHYGLVYYTTNDSNKYIRLYLCDLDNLSILTDYTAITVGTTRKQTVYQYLSIDYLPNVGYLLFYNYPQNTNDGFKVRILRTYDEITGEQLPYNQYVLDSHDVITVGGSSTKIVQHGSHGWYCPWTKEYYFVPNASQVFWTKDGINWNSSATTGLSSSSPVYKFFVNGYNSIIIANSATTFYYSTNKGQNWYNDVGALSPNAFNTSRSTDSIVLPFKCTNNIGIDTSNITLGYYLNTTNGQPTSDEKWFYTNDYISIDPDTAYVFYGTNTVKEKTRRNSISFYDSNKNWISTTEGYGSGSLNNQLALVTSPSNAAYARVSCRLSDSAVVTSNIPNYQYFFAKEDDFKVMTNCGDIVCN